jgi:DnaK suppressor protein
MDDSTARAELKLDEALEGTFPASDPLGNTVETGVLTGAVPSPPGDAAKGAAKDVAMNVQDYRTRLVALEKRLSARSVRGQETAREQVPDSPGDAGDASVAEEGESQAFTEAELDVTVLQQVRDALRRIEDGTFGRCVVDGEPIEEKRLDAVPWTPYCLEHQARLEAESPPRTPTL